MDFLDLKEAWILDILDGGNRSVVQQMIENLRLNGLFIGCGSSSQSPAELDGKPYDPPGAVGPVL